MMNKHALRWGLLLAAALTLAACDDRREPVKPKVAATAVASTGA